MALLTIVLPSYNEEAMLPLAAATLKQVMDEAGIHYELMFVDDGSKDRTWEEIQKAAEKDPQVHGVHFSRNFGKESAIIAGLGAAQGDCVAVMDCDLQHPPAALVDMYRCWEQGYEVVEGVKRSRGSESLMHKASAGAFYKLMSDATGIDMMRASDFKLLDRRAVETLLEMPERNAFFRAQSAWIGYKTTTVEFDVQEREAGESKWSTKQLIKYAISNIAAYSTAPMQWVTGAGAISFVVMLILAVRALVLVATGRTVSAMAGLTILILLIGSILMTALGIIGYYLMRIYQEVQGRPRYIISRRV